MVEMSERLGCSFYSCFIYHRIDGMVYCHKATERKYTVNHECWLIF